MGRLDGELLASAVGAVSVRTIDETNSRKTSSSLSSLKKQGASSSLRSQYTTRSGQYSMSTSFSDNIKFGRKKKPVPVKKEIKATPVTADVPGDYNNNNNNNNNTDVASITSSATSITTSLRAASTTTPLKSRRGSVSSSTLQDREYDHPLMPISTNSSEYSTRSDFNRLTAATAADGAGAIVTAADLRAQKSIAEIKHDKLQQRLGSKRSTTTSLKHAKQELRQRALSDASSIVPLSATTSASSQQSIGHKLSQMFKEKNGSGEELRKLSISGPVQILSPAADARKNSVSTILTQGSISQLSTASSDKMMEPTHTAKLLSEFSFKPKYSMASNDVSVLPASEQSSSEHDHEDKTNDIRPPPQEVTANKEEPIDDAQSQSLPDSEHMQAAHLQKSQEPLSRAPGDHTNKPEISSTKPPAAAHAAVAPAGAAAAAAAPPHAAGTPAVAPADAEITAANKSESYKSASTSALSQISSSTSTSSSSSSLLRTRSRSGYKRIKMPEYKHKPIMITNVGKQSAMMEEPVNPYGSVRSFKREGSSNSSSSGFSFFRGLRKKHPEMVSSSDAQFLKRTTSPFDDQLSTSSGSDAHDSSGRSVYPVFKLPLEQAIKLNTPFESTDIFTKSDEIDLEICDLEYHKYVPLIVLKCIKFITKHAMDEEGLYRVSGSTNDVKRLQERFINEGPTFDISLQEEDIHTVTSLFKLYLRELPDELITIDRHQFLAYRPELMYQLGDDVELPYQSIPMQVLQEELMNLPFVNFALLHVLIRHFANIVKHERKNRMSLSNLAVCFAPTLEMSKALFMALVARGDLLWKDLHPTTPKPKMDQTFNSIEPYHKNEVASKILDEHLDKMSDEMRAQVSANNDEFDFYQQNQNYAHAPRKLHHHHQNQHHHQHHAQQPSYQSYSSSLSGSTTSGIGLGVNMATCPIEEERSISSSSAGTPELDDDDNEQDHHRADHPHLTSSISTRSLRSLDSSPDTVMTDPEFFDDQPMKPQQQHPSSRKLMMTIDARRAKYNRSVSSTSSAPRSPRLFLGPSSATSERFPSRTSPTNTPATTHHA